MADINLLPVAEKEAENLEVLRKRLTIVSIVLLVFTAVFTLITLGLFTSFASQRSNLITKIEASSNEITSLKATEELIVVIKGKVSAGYKILTARVNFANIFGQLSGLVPAGVYFTYMRFTSDKVIISGKAKTSAEMAGLVSSLTSASGSQIISSVNIDSLNSDENGVFSFAISGQLAVTK